MVLCIGALIYVVVSGEIEDRKPYTPTAYAGEGRGRRSEPAVKRDLMGEYQVQARQALDARLKDPASAKYASVFGYEQASGAYIFCGTVNAKNSYGGYSGTEHFVAGPGMAALASDGKEFSGIWREMCVGKPRTVWF